jgi:hypothetical protein
MKVYIAGRITGLPDYQERFAKAAQQLTNDGHQPVNPALLGSGDRPWTWYMKRALQLMLGCDAVYMLTGWEDSRGAPLELYVAVNCGMTVMHEVRPGHDETGQ